MMLKLLLLAAVITAAASIDCTTWSCIGENCTPESDGSATTCDAGVEFCLTIDRIESGMEYKASGCDGLLSNKLICPSSTDKECRYLKNADGEATYAMCSKTTPPKGIIPWYIDCTTGTHGQTSPPTTAPPTFYCTEWDCSGVGCTPESDGSATTCDAGVDFCLTIDRTDNLMETARKSSGCDSMYRCHGGFSIWRNATDGDCRIDSEITDTGFSWEQREMCSKTTPPNGMIPASTSCTTSGQASPPTAASAPARTTMSVVAVFGFAAIMKQLF